MTPLIGDTDGGQAVPILSRSANDHSHLLTLGAVVFRDSQLKLPRLTAAPELLWLAGENGVQAYEQLPSLNEESSSKAFTNSGTYLLRHGDLFLLFNAGGAHDGRPASHRHNDALSIEVFACGRAFIVDPGTYVYTADLHERHLFRSTSYHSTIEIDDAEQAPIREELPFVTGGEARVRVSLWESTPEYDRVVAEHNGYQRLADGVTHRRTVVFNKQERWWLIEDEIFGKDEHKVVVRFHFDAGLDVRLFGEQAIIANDEASGARLIVCPITAGVPQPAFEPQFVSRHYGSQLPSTTANWSTSIITPGKLRWAIIPVCVGEDPKARLSVLQGSG
jgi:hypothetical protein